MKIAPSALQHIKHRHNTMRNARGSMWSIWRELAATYLPYRHPWLLSSQKSETVELNPNFITGIGLRSLRVQSAGLMNGITSPTRPWIKLAIGSNPAKLQLVTTTWLSQASSIMHTVLARSNFYNTLAMSYHDIGLMGSSGISMYEDRRDVLRTSRYNTGEYYMEYDAFGRLRSYSRELKMTLVSIKEQFGEEAFDEEMAGHYATPERRGRVYNVIHFCSRDIPDLPTYVANRPWKEVYYIPAKSGTDDNAISVKGFKEAPSVFPRWSSELEYGMSPGMEALGDMRELIQLILDKGIGIETMTKPPLLFDQFLRNNPRNTLPGGHTFVPNLANFIGGKPLYTVNVPVQELRADIMEVKQAIEATFHNPLFTMFSQLDTVRSATEIDARREERLVMLAHFLERFENEALDPLVERAFNLCLRAGLFPDPPEEVLQNEIDIQYVSILTTAQRALNTVPIERLLQMVGQVMQLSPNVLDLLDFDRMVHTYAEAIDVNPTVFAEDDAIAQKRQQNSEAMQAQSTMESSGQIIDAARNLSETDVGGGANALQLMLGNS